MPSFSQHRHRSAFTLLEMLLVLVILAVLAGIALHFIANAPLPSGGSKPLADLHGLETALELYKRNCGTYPATLDGLITDTGAHGWAGPYINHGLPVDPWHHCYSYRFPGKHNPDTFDLSTDGDGKVDVSMLNNWTRR